MLDRLFGRQPEMRASDYTELITNALEEAANQTTDGGVAGSASGALEACAGIWGRAFASAHVSPDNAMTRAVTPAFLSLLGRSLCREGELVCDVQIDAGMLTLLPAGWHYVYGGPRPSSWLYHLESQGPTQTTHEYRGRAGVAHFHKARYRLRSRAGRWPATSNGRSGRTPGTTTGYIVPTPESTTLDANTKATVKGLKGKLAFLKSLITGLGDKNAAPADDWKSRRLGPAPPEAVVQLCELATALVASACGVPPSLVTGGRGSDGTTQREALRRLLHLTLGPLGKLVAAELSRVFDQPITLSFEALNAADVAGRARAWRSLVGKDANMPDADARTIVGIE